MLEFIDTIYKVKGNFHTRKIVRAILLDKDNNIVLEQVERDDDFGYSYYVETPGGGINIEENEIEALKSENKALKEVIGEVYKTIDEVPEWYKPTIEKLIDSGAIKGTGNNNLNLPEIIVRTLVIENRR